jgi:anti-sigma B factor antagonist
VRFLRRQRASRSSSCTATRSVQLDHAGAGVRFECDRVSDPVRLHADPIRRRLLRPRLASPAQHNDFYLVRAPWHHSKRAIVTSAFKIDTIHCGGRVVLHVEGELDISTAPWLDRALAEAKAGDARSIVLDLGRLDFIDSSGLCVLMLHARCDSQSGRLLFRKGSPQVQRVFELSGTAHLLPFSDRSDSGNGCS